ncbi:MAG: 16S rRNA (guanine(966)-N(2))-methyltransferase RsmD [Candidatus Nitrohelix vancouverensis]|uniref:16S rRNA (Guanine(966)-N(2))-methyltransferase RsmD n=1 Tax=Candidatus Nitrohelix vancouverensis TaxID=2705534 RepID=A0A7T0C4E2_9BACT|nr:MAG: 16S rRNA (guanine(966)-N(2))-methyltransferase RsmD [Candidatus Nitrohelix vancouverensis]
MRIIAGSARGRKLAALGDRDIRPTLDRVKESFFNQVGPYLDGLNFLDLFAGSGSMGLEALSRGAERVVFVEQNSEARRLILDNLKRCGFVNEDAEGSGNRWRLVAGDALSVLDILSKGPDRFDLLYVDPPFSKGLYGPCLTKIAHSGILNEGAFVVTESHRKEELLGNYDTLSLFKERRLGDTRLSFFSLSS